MRFSTSAVCSLVALAGISSAAFHKRATTSISLFAYGGAAGGAPVFYADGLAYIGKSAPSGASIATNITFSEDPDDTSVAWTISANSTNATSINGMELYIVTTNGSFAQAGFSSTNTTLASGAVATGFSWFGKNAGFEDSTGAVNLFYWAEPVTSTLWKLMWNQAGTPSNGSFPVTLKLTPPITPRTS